jgi:hypothetical protein
MNLDAIQARIPIVINGAAPCQIVQAIVVQVAALAKALEIGMIEICRGQNQELDAAVAAAYGWPADGRKP